MSDRKVTILFGAPGTGKTTRLINIVADALKKGIQPDRIGYFAFTRKAAQEAKARALEKLGMSKESLPYFRTLHSMAFRLLELKKEQVMSTEHYRDLGKSIGVVFKGTYDYTEDQVPIDIRGNGDKCLTIYSRYRARQTSLEYEWKRASHYDLPFVVVKRFVKALEDYKNVTGLVDFCDMVDLCEDILDLDICIIDEAQDLTYQQWAIARRLGAKAKEVYIAGDDDQSIYEFSGATVDPLLTIQGEREVLPVSHRLPRRIKNLADKISGRIKKRVHKNFSCRDEEGLVDWLREMDDVDLSEGNWLLLARNRHQLDYLEEMARRKGVAYYRDGKWSNNSTLIRSVINYERLRRGETLSGPEAIALQRFVPGMRIVHENQKISWSDIIFPFQENPTWMEALAMSDYDREYIRGLRRRKEPLGRPGRVTISTVHGIKGGEAQNVLLLTDISSRVVKGAMTNPDSEWRVLYVGVSRAINSLFLVKPRTMNFWNV